MPKNSPRILLVDDDLVALKSVRASLLLEGLAAEIHTAHNVQRAKELFESYAPQVVVTDLSLVPSNGADSGYELLSHFQQTRKLPFRAIVLTGFDDTRHGIRALERGASHFIAKPPNVHHLKILIDDAIMQSNLLREKSVLEEELLGVSALIGASRQMKQLREEVSFCARSKLAVLILGEPGTGKSLCAKEIHRLSALRSKGRFVKYQPGVSSSEIVVSDLFGHAKGSFTGADHARRGLIAEADGGTFFLDEIDALPLSVQAFLLGALQDGELRGLGSNETTLVDVRFIGATNKNISTLVAQGALREDFVGRLSHLVIELPPLRMRKEDIGPIALSVLERVHEREGYSVFDISSAALSHLHAHSWPGNIRELEGVIERAALMAHDNCSRTIAPVHVRLSTRQETPAASKASDTLGYEAYMNHVEKDLILKALARCAGNQSEAARLLKMDRHTLRRIVAREGICDKK